MKKYILPLALFSFSLLFTACKKEWDGYEFDGTFAPEYQAVYDSLSTKPSSKMSEAQNHLVWSMVNAGLWDRADYTLIPAAGSEADALLNWKDLSVKAENPTSTRWNPYRGFKGDGVDDYILLNYIPARDAIHASLNSFTILIVILNNIQDDDHVVYSDGFNSYTRFLPRTTTDYQAVSINSPAMHMQEYGITSSAGTHIITRTNDMTTYSYHDGTLRDLRTDMPSTSMPDSEMVLLKDDDGFTAHEIALFMILDGVNAGEVTSLNRIVQTYLDDLGL